MRDYQVVSVVLLQATVTTGYHAIGPFRSGSRLDKVRYLPRCSIGSSGGLIGFGVSYTGDETAEGLAASTPLLRHTPTGIGDWMHAEQGYGSGVGYTYYSVEPRRIVRGGAWWVLCGITVTGGRDWECFVEVTASWPVVGRIGGVEVGGAGAESKDAEGLADEGASTRSE